MIRFLRLIDAFSSSRVHLAISDFADHINNTVCEVCKAALISSGIESLVFTSR